MFFPYKIFLFSLRITIKFYSIFFYLAIFEKEIFKLKIAFTSNSKITEFAVYMVHLRHTTTHLTEKGSCSFDMK